MPRATPMPTCPPSSGGAAAMRVVRRRWRARLQLLAIATLLAFATLEGGIRLLHLDFDLSHVWRWHPTLGWTQRPGLTYDFTYQGDPVHIEFNARGFRDVEHALAKQPGTRRIVVVGDSFCEAVQVNLEQTFFHRLQQQLNDGAQQWEVVNLGVGDFGPAQELIALQELGFEYQPDLVVCEVFPLNDIGNDSMALATWCRSENDFYRPYFVEQDGALRLTYLQPLRQRLRSWFATFRILEKVLLRLRRRDAVETDAARRQRLTAAGFPPLDPLLQTYVEEPQQIEPVRAGWRITELCLQRMVELCRARGIQIVFVIVPFEGFVGAGAAEFIARLPPPRVDPGYPARRLGALCRRLDVPCVDLAPVFEHANPPLPWRDGHFGPEAHAAVAHALHEKLTTLGLVK